MSRRPFRPVRVRAATRSYCGLSPGFSLVELLVALVLGLLLAEGFFVLFSATRRASAMQTALAAVQRNGRIAMESIEEDLRSAGHMPCGTRTPPVVFAEDLARHVTGEPAAANAPASWPVRVPYPLNRAVFVTGYTCVAETCTPALSAGQALPPAGLAVGDRVPGTDVLTVRYLRDDGRARGDGVLGQTCDASDRLLSIAADVPPSTTTADAWLPSHLALLTTCSESEIFALRSADGKLQPMPGKTGLPRCLPAAERPRLFDLDAQLLTTEYYLQLVLPRNAGKGPVAALMRRRNGAVAELARGIERLNFRYSITDAAGLAHWLTAPEVGRGTTDDGTTLMCRSAVADPVRACTWSDLDAVEISLLADSIDDLPAGSSRAAEAYHYSIDDDRPRMPAASLLATGLPAGHKLRREFHTVVALRSLHR